MGPPAAGPIGPPRRAPSPGARPPLPFDDGPGAVPRPPDRAGRTLAVVMCIIAALTVLGLIALWPRGKGPDLAVQPRTYVDATVTDIDKTATCPAVEVSGPSDCVMYGADLTSGPDKSTSIEFPVLPTQVDVPDLHVGDHVVLMDVKTSPPPFR